MSQERTARDLHEATLEAVGATRCVLQSDQAGLAVLLSGSEDIYLLAAQGPRPGINDHRGPKPRCGNRAT